AEVDKLLRAGKVFGSSGSLPNFVRTDHKTGEILVWPYIEQTLTPTPANPYSVVLPVKAARHFEAAQIGLGPISDLDSLKADLTTDLSADGDEGAAQPASDLSTDGDAAAIQRLAMDPNRERA